MTRPANPLERDDAIPLLAVRRRVGEAAVRIAKARRAGIEAKSDLVSAAHKRWRDLADQAREAEREYDQIRRTPAPSREDLAIIMQAKLNFPELLFHEEYAPEDPMTCVATGLVLCRGDETYGDPEYGAVLKAAIEARIPPVEGFEYENMNRFTMGPDDEEEDNEDNDNEEDDEAGETEEDAK